MRSGVRIGGWWAGVALLAGQAAWAALPPGAAPPAAPAAPSHAAEAQPGPAGTSGERAAPAAQTNGGDGRVEPVVSMRAAKSGEVAKLKKSYEVSVKDGAWADSGIDVAAGEVLSFEAKGQITLAGDRVTGPEGVERGFKDLLRIFPLNSAKTGELIGRVSNVEASYPFEIGAQGKITMPTRWRLFLRVNASDDLEPAGEFKVKIQPAKVEPAEAKATAPQNGEELAKLISPATFAGIPRRVRDAAGDPGDMVNFALLGTKAQVEAAFKAAGWVEVDKTVEDAVVHGILSTLSREAYIEMPMSTLYLFGRPQDLSFARGDPLKIAAERHHLRVWQTENTVGGVPLWVGSATHDVGFEKDQRNGNVTHRIDPKVDGERDFLLQSFDAAGVFSSAAYVTPANPLREAHTATGGEFESDGRIAVMRLK